MQASLSGESLPQPVMQPSHHNMSHSNLRPGFDSISLPFDAGAQPFSIKLKEHRGFIRNNVVKRYSFFCGLARWKSTGIATARTWVQVPGILGSHSEGELLKIKYNSTRCGIDGLWCPAIICYWKTSEYVSNPAV